MADELDASTDVKRIEKLIGLDLDKADEGRVEVYITDAKQAIMMYIKPYLDGRVEFPHELNYLVDQLVLAKYNKYHNEGMNSISEEGLTMSFNQNDLKDYLPDIQAWIDASGLDDSQDGDAMSW